MLKIERIIYKVSNLLNINKTDSLVTVEDIQSSLEGVDQIYKVLKFKIRT